MASHLLDGLADSIPHTLIGVFDPFDIPSLVKGERSFLSFGAISSAPFNDVMNFFNKHMSD